MTILLLDGYNLFHIARSGFRNSEYSIIFNFFRNIRPLIEQFKPEQAFLVLEGTPEQRLISYDGYKASRQAFPEKERESFYEQINSIIKLVEKYFPIQVVKHPKYECDDVIAFLAKKYSAQKLDVTIISTDTDFIQLLTNDKISLYNPVKKNFVCYPRYDYLVWKSLRGDKSDNIPGIPGIGDKTAEKLAKDEKLFIEKIKENPEKKLQFDLNFQLIKFHEISDLSLLDIGNSYSNWDMVKKEFNKMQFNSITNEKSWKKFVSTFSSLELCDCLDCSIYGEPTH